MEISRDSLSKKLDTIPESDREPYLQALQSKGYTWKSNNQDQGQSDNYLTTSNLDNAPKLDPLAQVARLGQFADRGNQQLADIVAEKSGQLGAMADNAGFPTIGKNITYGGIGAAGALGTASQFLIPQNRLGVAAQLMAPVAEAYQYLKGPANGYSKPGMVAQLGQARTKVPASDIQQYINDPSIASAPSVAEANANYGKVAGPLQGATQSLGQKLNKTVLGEADFTEAVNKAGRLLNGTEIDAAGNPTPLDAQSALEGVQSINRFIKNKQFTSKLDGPQFSAILDVKNGLMDWMEKNGSPGLRDAATQLRKAHVNENMSNFMPQNKFGSTDALRTMFATGGLGAAGALALAGHPIAAIPVAAEAITASPMVLGGLIRNYQAATNPQNIKMAGVAVTAGLNFSPGSLENYYKSPGQP